MCRCRLASVPGPQSSPDARGAAVHEVAAARAARAGVGARAAEDRDAQRHAVNPMTAPRRDELGAEQPPPSSAEPVDVARRQEACVPAAGAFGASLRARARVEHGAHLERGLVGRRHEHDVAAHHVADRTGEVRVVRAAEQQRVDLGLARPARAAARRARAPGRSSSRPARRTRRTPGTPRTSASTSALGRGDRRWYAPEPIVPTVPMTPDAPGAGRAARAPARRARSPRSPAPASVAGQVVERRRRRGVARDDDGLHAVTARPGGRAI